VRTVQVDVEVALPLLRRLQIVAQHLDLARKRAMVARARSL